MKRIFIYRILIWAGVPFITAILYAWLIFSCIDIIKKNNKEHDKKKQQPIERSTTNSSSMIASSHEYSTDKDARIISNRDHSYSVDSCNYRLSRDVARALSSNKCLFSSETEAYSSIDTGSMNKDR